VRGGVGFGAQGGTLALRRHCLVDCHLYILGMMAWLSNGYSKRKLSKVQRLACLGITGVIRATPTGAMEALVGLPPLDLVIQWEARLAAHRLWSPGCWS